MTPRTTVVLRGFAVVAAITIIAVVAATIGLPSQDELTRTFAGYGWWAPAVFAVLYALVTLTPLPKTVFSLAAGVIFGIPMGLGAVLVGALVGAVAAFGLARALGKDTVHRWLGHRLDGLDRGLEQRGFITIVVARLIPVIPFTTTNYLAGLTSMPLGQFTTATALGILPASSAYVTLGAYGTRPGAWPFWVALGALAILTLAGAALAVLRRRRPTTAAPDGTSGAGS